MPEHRIHPRADIQLGVQYRPVKAFITASSMNIGQGGMYVCTPDPLPRGHEIQLLLTFPGVALPLQVSGTVIWSNPGNLSSPFPRGMGIKFLSLTDADANLIAEFVAKAKGPGELPAPAPVPAPPAPVAVTVGAAGEAVPAVPAGPALAMRVPPTAKLSDSVQIIVLPDAPPAMPAAPPPSASEPEIPAHVRRQMEYMMSLQAPPTATEPVRPTPPEKSGKSSQKSPPPRK